MTAGSRTKTLTRLALLIAIELMVGLIPMLGYIPMPGLQITTQHIPVIIAGALLGVKGGAAVGFVFGLTSFLNATFIQPNPIFSPLFSPFYSNGVFEGNALSLVICFVPRILVGVVAALVFKFIVRALKGGAATSSAVAAVFGSMTNTVLVLLGIYFFFGAQYAGALDIPIDQLFAIAVGGTIVANGIPEAIAAVVLTATVCKIVISVERASGKRREDL